MHTHGLLNSITDETKRAGGCKATAIFDESYSRRKALGLRLIEDEDLFRWRGHPAGRYGAACIRAGWQVLGGGCFGFALQHPDHPGMVRKVCGKGDGWLGYARWIANGAPGVPEAARRGLPVLYSLRECQSFAVADMERLEEQGEYGTEDDYRRVRFGGPEEAKAWWNGDIDAPPPRESAWWLRPPSRCSSWKRPRNCPCQRGPTCTPGTSWSGGAPASA